MTRAQLDVIARRIAELSLRIDTAKHALLVELREFDAHEGWADTSLPSTAAWLSWWTNMGAPAAREHVRVARALGDLPLTDAAFAAGKLSYSKVRAITRIATRETEQDFIEIGMSATASQLERLTRAYRRTQLEPGQNDGDRIDQRRYVRRSETASGMVRIDMQLPPEQANVVWEALEAALDAGRGDVSAETRGTAAGVEQASEETHASAETPCARMAHPNPQLERADAIVSIAQAYLQHRPRTLGSGYELVMFSSLDQLEQGPGGVGGFLRDGTAVPLHVARMLACDSKRVDVQLGDSGELLDVGRARRTIPSAIGRALWLRDGGCRAPGCGRRHHLHAHHIEAWAEGGNTAMSNLVLLCPRHHALVHEGRLSVELRDGQLEFVNCYGLPLPTVPEHVPDRDELEQWLKLFDPAFDFDDIPRWDGTRFELGPVLDAVLHATAA